MKHLLLRAAPAAWCNCSKGVTLGQAPWKPLLWDWRQKQPCIGSCATAAKNSPKNFTKTLVAQSWYLDRNDPEKPRGKKFVMGLAVPYCSLPRGRRGAKQRGQCYRVLFWRGPSSTMLREHAGKEIFISDPINSWVTGLEWNKGQWVSKSLFTWFIRMWLSAGTGGSRYA